MNMNAANATADVSRLTLCPGGNNCASAPGRAGFGRSAPPHSGLANAASIGVSAWRLVARARGGLLAITGLAFLVVATALHAADTNALEFSHIESLTLEQALTLAAQRHPQLAEAAAQIEAASGRADQAGRFPNPEAIVGAQQIPFRSGAPDEREYVAGIAQPLPLGGRLGREREVEALEREVRVRGLDVVYRDLRQRIHAAFATALYQEEAAALQRRMLAVVEAGVATTRARVNTGDVAPDELKRWEIEHARAQLESQRTAALQTQAMTDLLAALGDSRLQVSSLAGNLHDTFAIPTLESLVTNLAALPEVQLAGAEWRARNARIGLARAERIPDVRVELLYHRLEGSGENTLDVGLSIPLPLFNRNQGRLREARAEAAAAEARAQATLTGATLDLRSHYAQLEAALAMHRTWTAEILPRAESILRVAEARYAAGDLSLADLLPARRDWAAAQLSHLESLRDVMQAWNQLARFHSPN